MNVNIPAMLRRLKRQQPQAPEEYPCLLTQEDTDLLLYTAKVNPRLGGLPDETKMRLPSGIILAAGEARRWMAENAQSCRCPDCQAGEAIGDEAAEMGLLLLTRRMAHEAVEDTTVAEQMMFGYIMACLAVEEDDGELAWAKRLTAEYFACRDAGDTDGTE